jgi:hypothetical protein
MTPESRREAKGASSIPVPRATAESLRLPHRRATFAVSFTGGGGPVTRRRHQDFRHRFSLQCSGRRIELLVRRLKTGLGRDSSALVRSLSPSRTQIFVVATPLVLQLSDERYTVRQV